MLRLLCDDQIYTMYNRRHHQQQENRFTENFGNNQHLINIMHADDVAVCVYTLPNLLAA